MKANIPDSKEGLFMEDIIAVDFTMIKLKLQDTEEGKGWTVEKCDETETEYKRFLALKRTYPGKEIVLHYAVNIF